MIEVAQVVDINPWAVLVATLVAFGLGAIWYAPALFGNEWKRMHLATYKGVTEKKMREGATSAYLASFFTYLVMAYVLSYFIGLLETATVLEGLVVASWAALGFVVTLSLSDAIFTNERKKLWAINTGYKVASILAMGAIIGAWK